MSAPVPPTRDAGPQRIWFPRTVRQWLAAAAIAMFVLVVISYLLARMTPSWYAPLDPNSDRVIDLAGSLQNKLELHNVLQRVPLGDQPWTISQDEINAMIAIRHQPLPVTDPMVIFTPGKITLAARVAQIPGNHPAGGVGSVVFTMETFPARGELQMPTGLIKVKSAWLGNLPVPRSIVENRISSLVPTVIKAVNQELALHQGSSWRAIPEVDTAIRAMLQGEPFPVRFPYERRTIVVKEVRVEDGSMTIVFGPPTPAGVPPRAPPPSAVR